MRVIAHVEPNAAETHAAKLYLACSDGKAQPRKAEANNAPKVLRDHRVHWGIAVFWLAYFSAVIGGAFVLGWWLA